MVMDRPALRAPFWICWPLKEENALTSVEQIAIAAVAATAKDFIVWCCWLGWVPSKIRFYDVRMWPLLASADAGTTELLTPERRPRFTGVLYLSDRIKFNRR